MCKNAFRPAKIEPDVVGLVRSRTFGIGPDQSGFQASELYVGDGGCSWSAILNGRSGAHIKRADRQGAGSIIY